MPGINGLELGATTIVSPCSFGDEEKNQDRAKWFPSQRIAALGDGLTSSPNSGEAAQCAVELSPILFRRNAEAGMRAISDLLITRREEAQQGEITLPDDVPENMRTMLGNSAREQLAHSYQTTLVAVRLKRNDGIVALDAVVCGDSAFFAFAPDGDLLASSFNFVRGNAQNDCVRIVFGEEVLIKIVSTLAEEPGLAENAGIAARHIDKWFVCKILDKCDKQPFHAQATRESVWLNKDEQILVPRYLVGTHASEIQPYPRIWFSRVIRRIGQAQPRRTFGGAGSATCVLPDHVESKQWTQYREEFPLDTQFILASDGLHGSFDSPSELWGWLMENACELRDPTQREFVMNNLHAERHAERSDDDISFVWVYALQQGGKLNLV